MAINPTDALLICGSNGQHSKDHIDNDPEKTRDNHDSILLFELLQVWFVNSARLAEACDEDPQRNNQQKVYYCRVHY